MGSFSTDRIPPPRVPVVGSPISKTTLEEVIRSFGDPPHDRAAVVAVCNVHSVMSSRRDVDLARAIAGSDIATPDGMPVVWAIRAIYDHGQDRVAGPDLMEEALRAGVGRGTRHFLYGTTRETLDRLEEVIRRIDPAIIIAGSLAPPFGTLTDEELVKHADEIKATAPDVVWVGLGMPKQELWMHRVRPLLPRTTLVGVGAAFDLLAGNQRRAPRWMQRSGLEWFYRLIQEPGRMWKRYAWNNPAFLALLGLQIVRHRTGRFRRSVSVGPR